MREDYHLGRAIREELDRQERSVTWFANQIYCSRSHVYRIFEKDNLDVKLLLRISSALRYDFLKEMSNNYLSHI